MLPDPAVRHRHSAALARVVAPLAGVALLLSACLPGQGGDAPVEPLAEPGVPAALDGEAAPAETTDARPAAPPVADPPPVAREIRVQPGMEAVRWAEGLGNPTGLAVAPDGRVFVADGGGRIWVLWDADGNGAADHRKEFVAGLSQPSSLVIAPLPPAGDATVPEASAAPASVGPTRPAAGQEAAGSVGDAAGEATRAEELSTAAAGPPDAPAPSEPAASTGDGTQASETAAADPHDEAAGATETPAAVAGIRILVREQGGVRAAVDRDGDNRADHVERVVGQLPDGAGGGGGIAIGPDGRLYVGVGWDSGNAAPGPFAGTVVAIDPITGVLVPYVRGLVHPVALAFAADGSLWVTDRGSGSRCSLPDVLLRVDPGSDQRRTDCSTGLFETAAGDASDGAAAVLAAAPGAGSGGMAWLQAEIYPPTLRSGFLIFTPGAIGTSRDPTGTFQVLFAQITDVQHAVLRDVAAGFPRPVAVAIAPDLSVHVLDAAEGVLYRIGAPFEGRGPS